MKGKEGSSGVSASKPYRAEFRYPKGTKHYQYFETADEADRAKDTMQLFDPPWISRLTARYPLSKQIQVRGPRGGWSKWESI